MSSAALYLDFPRSTVFILPLLGVLITDISGSRLEFLLIGATHF